MRSLITAAAAAALASGAATAAALAPGAAAPPGAAAHPARSTPQVELMVVGAHGTLVRPRQVRLRARTATIGRRRCSVPAGTALAGLLASRVPVRVTDQAGCDPSAMFVTKVRGERNRGQGGWEYKVGRKDPSAGAGDPAGSIRAGRTLLWYWCTHANACERTLSVRVNVDQTSLRVRVVGFDENGHGIPIPGASVHYARTTAITSTGGDAVLPLRRGIHEVYASKPGSVRSFPDAVGAVP